MVEETETYEGWQNLERSAREVKWGGGESLMVSQQLAKSQSRVHEFHQTAH